MTGGPPWPKLYISAHGVVVARVAFSTPEHARHLSTCERGAGERSGREAAEPVLPRLGLGRRVAVVEVVRGREDHVVVAVDQHVHRVVGTHAHEARRAHELNGAVNRGGPGGPGPGRPAV